MTRIAIIAALPGELKPFLSSQAKEGWVYEKRGNVKLWRLIQPSDQGEWVAACAGAGQSAATRALAAIEQDGPVSCVISAGWAGALSEQFVPGQAYSVSGVIDSRTGERFEADHGQGACLLVTSPIVANHAEKSRLASAYSAALVDMEAAAIARLAQMRGIPFYCTKGVSDGYSDNLPDFNQFLDPAGQLQLGRFTLFALLRPWLWPSLIKMGENSRRAAKQIARCILNDLGHIRTRNGYPSRIR